MTRSLLLTALLAAASLASAQTSVRPAIAAPSPATVYAGLYATDGGMLEVRADGTRLSLIAHGAPVAARLVGLAPPDAATDARAEALLHAWVLGDLTGFVDAARPSRRADMADGMAAYRAALVRGRGEAIAGRVLGTFPQPDGRRATLAEMLFDHGAEWAAFVWDEDGALVTVRRGLPPVELGLARPAGPDAFMRGTTRVRFAREADGRVFAVQVGDRFEAVR